MKTSSPAEGDSDLCQSVVLRRGGQGAPQIRARVEGPSLPTAHLEEEEEEADADDGGDDTKRVRSR